MQQDAVTVESVADRLSAMMVAEGLELDDTDIEGDDEWTLLPSERDEVAMMQAVATWAADNWDTIGTVSIEFEYSASNFDVVAFGDFTKTAVIKLYPRRY